MRVRVRVPASSANLGPGFDALALALALYNEVELEESDRVSVTIHGEGAGRLDPGVDNVVACGARMAFEAAGRSFRGATIHCVNRIPLGRGLGSSAAAWVGGLVGANALVGGPLDRGALLTLAARAEGHPDNVAAAILGGLTVSCSTEAGVVAVALPVPADIGWVVLLPEVESATRVDLLAAAMRDRLHQPYRLRLFPWMGAVEAAALEAGALGCALSGAGSAILAAVGGPSGAVARAMETALEAAGGRGRALTLAADTGGATWESLSRADPSPGESLRT